MNLKINFMDIGYNAILGINSKVRKNEFTNIGYRKLVVNLKIVW
jgi:hypothetical protein